MEIKIKDNWNEVSLGEYQQLVSIFNTDSDLLTQELLILEVLTNRTYDELQQLTTKQVKQLLTHTKFLQNKPEEVFKYEYIIDGEKYVPRLMIEDFEAGRFIDIQAYLENPNENLHLVMASILDKKIEYPKYKFWRMDTVEAYNDKDVKELANKIYNELPITEVNGLSAFFLRNYAALWTTIEDSLGNNPKEMMMRMISEQIQMKDMLSTGDGSSQSAELVKNEE